MPALSRTLCDGGGQGCANVGYAYDEHDRLKSVTCIDTSKTGAAYYLNQSRFSYDAFGNMKRAYEDRYNATTSAWEQDKWTDFAFQGGQIAEEKSSTGEKVRYTWGMGRDGGGGALLSRSVSVGTSWRNYNVVSDSSGNVASLVRQDTGLVVANYRYGAYKQIQARGIDAAVTADALDRAQVSAHSLLYQSKWQHKPSGLINFGFRFYNPGTYSWINPDPLGEAGGLNLYSYVGGDPVNFFDDNGLAKRPCNEIKSDIYGRVGEIAWRIEEMRIDRNYLYDFKDTPNGINPAHPKSGTWKTHEEQLIQQRANLKKLLKEWDDGKCGQGGGSSPASAWKWLTAPIPTMPRRESNKIVAKSVAGGAAVVGTGYLIYRGGRLLLSLPPPMWPTLIPNLVVP